MKLCKSGSSFKKTIHVIGGRIRENILSCRAAQDPHLVKFYNEVTIINISNEIGKLANLRLNLHIDKNVQSVATPDRRIPYGLRAEVEQQLKLLEENDIIEKVIGPTLWVTQ